MSGRRAVATVAVTTLAACGAAAIVMAISHPLGVALVGGVTAAALARFALQAHRHQRIVAALRSRSAPVTVAGTRVRMAPIDNRALVVGLWRPDIYCGTELPSRLTHDELRAVTLHERAHQQARDPLRLLLLEMAAPLARLHRRGRAWMQRTLAGREIAADRFALDRGASRRALASALLKVDPAPEGAQPGFAAAAELRIRALLTSEPAVGWRPRWRWVAPGLIAACGSCLWMWPGALATLCC